MEGKTPQQNMSDMVQKYGDTIGSPSNQKAENPKVQEIPFQTKIPLIYNEKFLLNSAIKYFQWEFNAMEAIFHFKPTHGFALKVSLEQAASHFKSNLDREIKVLHLI